MNIADRIWITYKCRMIAHTRYKRYYHFFEYLLVYYALFPVAFSIINLRTDSQPVNIAAVVASVIVLVLSVFLSAQKFFEKGEGYKSCYIQLQRLYQQIQHSPSGGPDSGVQDEAKISDQYHSILELSDNHSPFDYLTLKIQKRKTATKDKTVEEVTTLDWVQYYWHFLYVSLGIAVAFLLPIAGSFLLKSLG